MDLKRIVKVLNPAPDIGGLEINESDLRFVLIKGSELKLASLRLPAGIVEEGKIKNPADLKKILKELHSQVSPRRGKKIPVILNIPDMNVYTQVFSLPLVASANLDDAIKLNLRMISPVDFESAYSGWYKVGEVSTDGGQLEILGAFIQKQLIDEYEACLKEANFSVVAAEFSALALARIISGNASLPQALILLRLSSACFSFSIIRNGNLYFNHAAIWQGREITVNELTETLIRETQRVLNFYGSHWQSPVNDLTLMVPNSALEQKIAEIIKTNFNLQIRPLAGFVPADTQKLISSSLTTDWYSTLGSALRGLIPRSKDNLMSLTAVSTQEDFRQQQILTFIKYWRNIAFSSAIFLLFVFGGADVFLARTADSLNSRVAALSDVSAKSQEMALLKQQAESFNQKVDLVLKAKSEVRDWTPFLEKLRVLAGQEVDIDRVYVQSLETPVLLTGRASSEGDIIRFKTALSQDAKFQDVDLPLSAITPNVSGKVSFTISFRIKP